MLPRSAKSPGLGSLRILIRVGACSQSDSGSHDYTARDGTAAVWHGVATGRCDNDGDGCTARSSCRSESTRTSVGVTGGNGAGWGVTGGSSATGISNVVVTAVTAVAAITAGVSDMMPSKQTAEQAAAQSTSTAGIAGRIDGVPGRTGRAAATSAIIARIAAHRISRRHACTVVHNITIAGIAASIVGIAAHAAAVVALSIRGGGAEQTAQ